MSAKKPIFNIGGKPITKKRFSDGIREANKSQETRAKNRKARKKKSR